jgi:tRNA threonylcarbamoyl adenosine modification protein (Sua5/YciO/YrdC/YwlC family)
MNSVKAAVIRVDPDRPAPEAIAAAGEVLRRGGLVILPTDTVYGVAADPVMPGAEARLYAAKERDAGKPIPLLVTDISDVARWGAVVSGRGRSLARRYWPGPLTLVVRRGEGYEGFRVPNHPVALAVLKAVGGILRVTSANRSGDPAARDAAAAQAALGARVDLVLDAGPSPLGMESTVVQEDGAELRVLREGAIPARDILARPVILFVCTGNICRSPMAEYLLRQWLGNDTDWVVESAGLAAVDGLPITVEAAQVLAEKGIRAMQHTSRALTRERVDAARIIVVMTNAHRDLVQDRYPGTEDKIALMRSFGYSDREEDIADPIGEPLEVYRKVRDDMDALMPDLILDLQDLIGKE